MPFVSEMEYRMASHVRGKFRTDSRRIQGMFGGDVLRRLLEKLPNVKKLNISGNSEFGPDGTILFHVPAGSSK
jgi:hypothetical protein